MAAVAIVPVIRDIAKGDLFTSRSIAALGVLESVIAVGSGMTSVQAFLVLGVVGGIEFLRRCCKSGQKAQEELEGLV